MAVAVGSLFEIGNPFGLGFAEAERRLPSRIEGDQLSVEKEVVP
jgi:hypothetical protein